MLYAGNLQRNNSKIAARCQRRDIGRADTFRDALNCHPTTWKAMKKLVDLIHTSGVDNWSARCKEAFDELFGGGVGRYPARAQESYQLRAPDIRADDGVPFCALIHPSNPTSGPYGGTSFVLFPIENGPCLFGLGVGTQYTTHLNTENS